MAPVGNAVRVTAAAPTRLGESPFWHPLEQALYYVDIPGRALHRHDPAGGAARRWDLPAEPGSAVPTLDASRLLLAMRDGLWRFDTASGTRQLLAPPPYDPAIERFNDGKCDPQGRFWVGTIYEPRKPPCATLHCWAEGRLQQRGADITVSNGLAWSPDGATMYWTDTTAHTVRTFDFDADGGVFENGRVFATFPRREPDQPLADYGGRPDGAAVDSEGCYWVAMYEGGRLLRIAPDGTVLREVVLPVRCPTMPCFGGPHLTTIFVTTAREGRSAGELEREPHAGRVLAIDVDVPGLPVHLAV
jgi:sugar lactone lactonase YvrE